MEQHILFSESQRFNQWWLYLIMALATLIVIGAFVFMLLSKLQTEIKADGVYVRFFPMHSTYRKYTWDEMSKVYVRKYSPVSEYGGWGLKGFHNDRAWNVSGNMGLQLELKSGKKLLIGTQKPEEVKATLIALNKYKD